MQVDYYCFVMEKFGQPDYSEMRKRHKSCFFDNLEFDMNIAKGLGKFVVYCKETDTFYDENWEELNVAEKILFPRCIISDTEFLFARILRFGAIPFYTSEDYKKSEEWYKYIKPSGRKVVLTTYGEFAKNFKLYEKEFGRVFFKTAKKNISCEVKGVMDLGDMFFSEILSDDDIAETPSRYEDVPKREPMYAVFTNQSKGSNDHRFNWLTMDEPVLIEPFLTLKKDNRYANVPVEYRSFVIDGNFVTSRSWVPNTGQIPQGVKDITAQIVDAMPDGMQKSFVVDVLEYIDDQGESHFDLCEINPITSSGYEKGSSIFLLEDALGNDKFYPKYDLISEDQSE
jgi:hypothetical protein